MLIKLSISYELFGNSTLGYFYIDAYLGKFKEKQTLIFDTGSNLLLTDCDKCTHCGQHIDQPYKISESQSKKSATQIDNLQCNNDKCDFEISYKEGSSYEGQFYQEQISFAKNETSVYDIIGCIENETGLFYTQQADGIIGMAVSNQQAPNQYDILNKNGYLKNKKISICLGQNGGSFKFQSFNYELHKDDKSIQQINCEDESWDTFFITLATKIQIENSTKSIQNKAFFDTGTTLTYFPQDLYQFLIDNINKFCKENGNNCNGEQEIYDCFSTGILFFKDSNDILNTFPILTFTFNNVEYKWYPQQYFYQDDSDYCLGFDHDQDNMITLGANFMSQKDILFDLDKQVISFNEAQCSENNVQLHITSHLNQQHLHHNKVSQKFIQYRNKVPIFKRRIKSREKISFILIITIVITILFIKKKNKINTENQYREFFSLEESN